MKKSMLYKELAEYYDLIYSWKDYKGEAEKVRRLIDSYKMSDGNELLEVACGTGRHLQYMKRWFDCTGVDNSRSMIDIARSRVKGVRFAVADMTTLSLGRKFDVVSCLFSSIGYVKSYKNLNRTISNFSAHLKNGGVLVVEPWFTKSNYHPGIPHMTTYNGKHIKIARVNTSKIVGDLSITDMHYLVARDHREVKHLVDRHEIGLFDTRITLQYMKEAGLDVRYLKNGLMKDRGLFVGTKRS
jgi:ubiquinone/menaquinone biosynthesis C-methylase UbiE